MSHHHISLSPSVSIGALENSLVNVDGEVLPTDCAILLLLNQPCNIILIIIGVHMKAICFNSRYLLFCSCTVKATLLGTEVSMKLNQ